MVLWSMQISGLVITPSSVISSLSTPPYLQYSKIAFHINNLLQPWSSSQSLSSRLFHKNSFGNSTIIPSLYVAKLFQLSNLYISLQIQLSVKIPKLNDGSNSPVISLFYWSINPPQHLMLLDI